MWSRGHTTYTSLCCERHRARFAGSGARAHERGGVGAGRATHKRRRSGRCSARGLMRERQFVQRQAGVARGRSRGLGYCCLLVIMRRRPSYHRSSCLRSCCRPKAEAYSMNWPELGQSNKFELATSNPTSALDRGLARTRPELGPEVATSMWLLRALLRTAVRLVHEAPCLRTGYFRTAVRASPRTG